jgi:hypothetical protein
LGEWGKWLFFLALAVGTAAAAFWLLPDRWWK